MDTFSGWQDICGSVFGGGAGCVSGCRDHVFLLRDVYPSVYLDLASWSGKDMFKLTRIPVLGVLGWWTRIVLLSWVAGWGVIPGSWMRFFLSDVVCCFSGWRDAVSVYGRFTVSSLGWRGGLFCWRGAVFLLQDAFSYVYTDLAC